MSSLDLTSDAEDSFLGRSNLTLQESTFAFTYGVAFGSSACVGYVVRPGLSEWRHRFGGCSWRVRDERSREQPVLIMVLDLKDPALQRLRVSGLTELPLAIHMNHEVLNRDQLFRIEPQSREINLIQGEVAGQQLAADLPFPNPLPERSVLLRPMRDSEYPVDEASYWRNCSALLGGDSFIRVGGCPLWVQGPIKVECQCKRAMHFVMNLGYENFNSSGDFIDGVPLYLGEAALYFFVCWNCLMLRTIVQDA